MAYSPDIIYTLLVRLLAYFAILATLVTLCCVIIKCLGEWSERDFEDEGEGETSHLVSPKTVNISYGTSQQDIESGNCSSSESSNKKCTEGLYDPKICIICYDRQRNCFFVPCGHRATCRICAKRIFYEENRNCPVCRRFICKIREMLAS